MPHFFAMPDLIMVLICFIITTSFFTVIGIPIAARLFTRNMLLFSPFIGFLLYSSLLFYAYYLHSPSILFCYTLILFVGSIFIIYKTGIKLSMPTRYSILKVIIVILISIAIVASLFLKSNDTGYGLTIPMFDNVKIAIINSIDVNGIPPINPFVGFSDAVLNYYYIFYLVAASLLTFLPICAWSANNILTLFVSFSSIFLLYGILSSINYRFLSFKYFLLFIACTLSGGIFWVALNIFPSLHGIIYPPKLLGFIVHGNSAQTHLLSASAVFLALYLMSKLDDEANRYKNSIAAGVALGIALSASAWVSLIAFVVFGLCLAYTMYVRKWHFPSWLCFVLVGLFVALPFLVNQLGAVSTKFPIGFELFKWSTLSNHILVVLGYFTVYLVICFPFMYITTLLSLENIKQNTHTINFILLAVLGSILTSFLFKSTVMWNDLSWRGIFIAVFGMIIISCHYFITIKNIYMKAALIFLLSISFIHSFQLLNHGFVGSKARSTLSIDPKMYEVCAALTPPKASFLVNIWGYMPAFDNNQIWHAMSKRRSCLPSYAALGGYYPRMPLSQREQYLSMLQKIYKNTAGEADYSLLKTLECTNILVRKNDPLWNNKTPELYGWKVLFQNNEFRIYETN